MFALRGRNPDVLTCIANLSNDEIFTPPPLAEQMLDTLAAAWAEVNGGADLWANPTVTFLDPCVKSGVFLREIVKRLVSGLADEIPDLKERVDHILTRQVFGIGITSLTSLVARRTTYCSKWANGKHSITRSFEEDTGNIWFEALEHTWTGATEFVHTADKKGNSIEKPVNGKCRFCGANQRDYDRGADRETYAYPFIHTDDVQARVSEIFGGNMKFDVVIGNPPYQLGQSGGDAVGGFAMPVYQKFVRAAKSLDPNYIAMITPSRWFAGGRGLDDYRSEMLGDHRLRVLVDFPNAADAFPGTQIKGGVSYFLWDRGWEGPCQVTTLEEGTPTTTPMLRYLDAYDVLVRRNEAVPILEKVLKVNASDGYETLARKVSPIQPFSIRTNFKGSTTSDGLKDPVTVIGNASETFMERAEVPRNHKWIDHWKVLLGRAYGAGDSSPHQIYNFPMIAGPGTVCTETYLVIDRFASKKNAERCGAFLRTRFTRFLVSLRKNTQDIYSDRFSFVPDLPMDRLWTDDALYEKYGITDEEKAFIESMIRPMDDAKRE